MCNVLFLKNYCFVLLGDNICNVCKLVTVNQKNMTKYSVGRTESRRQQDEK